LPDFTSPVVLSPSFQSSQGGLRAMVVIDQSGSMADDNKLNYAKLAASLFVGSLQTGDQVGVIAFGDSITVTWRSRLSNYPRKYMGVVGTGGTDSFQKDPA
jgi:Mg-chelatase subunit ChlD